MDEKENRGYSVAVMITVFVVICAIFGFSFLSAQHGDKVKESRYVSTRTPTLLITGRGGSGKNFSPMTRYMKECDATNTVKTAVIDKDGTVHLSSTLKHTMRNPVIVVRFEDSSQKNWHRRAFYLKSLLSYLNKKYGYEDFNAVGYDEGAVTTAYYLLIYGNSSTLPHLRKFISIAGDFDRLSGQPRYAANNRFERNGRPAFTDDTYYELLGLRNLKLKHKIEVLNIYGKKSSKAKSDGVTSVVSARSLKYLVDPISRGYREIKVTGSSGRHSSIVTSSRTIKAVVHALWGKPAGGSKSNK